MLQVRYPFIKTSVQERRLVGSYRYRGRNKQWVGVQPEGWAACFKNGFVAGEQEFFVTITVMRKRDRLGGRRFSFTQYGDLFHDMGRNASSKSADSATLCHAQPEPRSRFSVLFVSAHQTAGSITDETDVNMHCHQLEICWQHRLGCSQVLSSRTTKRQITAGRQRLV